jgi:hypothetical protein
MNITTEFSIGDPVVFIEGSEVHYGKVRVVEVFAPAPPARTVVTYDVEITVSNMFSTGTRKTVNENKMAKDKPALMHKL